MTILARSLSILCVVSALAAQSPQAVLKLVPASVESVALTWKLAESNERYLKATASLHVKEGLVSLEGKGHLEAADLAPGTIAEVGFGNPEGTKIPKKAAKKPGKTDESGAPEPNWDLLIVPVKNPKALAKRLQAKPAGTLQVYQWKAGEETRTRHLGFKDGYAIIAERKELVEKVLKLGPSLEPELQPLMPWLQAHDTVMVLTEKALQKAAKGLIEEDAPGLTASNPLSSVFKALGEKIKPSVRCAVLALDLPQDGSIRLLARAFVKPGSPMSTELASVPVLPGHSLGRLPESPYAMAMGGQWPSSLKFMKRFAGQLPGLKPEESEALLKLSAKAQEQVQRIAFSWQAPAQAGDPLMQGVCGVAELKDGKAWMEAIKAQQAWMQEHTAGLMSYQDAVLPDLPSLTVNMDIRKLGGAKVPPMQMAMVGSLLFGGNQIQISYAVLDGRTMVYTFGDKEALKRSVAQVRENKPLSATPAIQGADLLLPKDARFVIYLDPSGIQSLAAAVAASFLGPDKKITVAELAKTLPLAGALSLDSAGIQFCGSARPESLEAMGKVFTGISQNFSKGSKDEATPGSDTPDGPDEPDEPDDDEDADDGA